MRSFIIIGLSCLILYFTLSLLIIYLKKDRKYLKIPLLNRFKTDEYDIKNYGWNTTTNINKEFLDQLYLDFEKLGVNGNKPYLLYRIVEYNAKHIFIPFFKRKVQGLEFVNKNGVVYFYPYPDINNYYFEEAKKHIFDLALISGLANVFYHQSEESLINYLEYYNYHFKEDKVFYLAEKTIVRK